MLRIDDAIQFLVVYLRGSIAAGTRYGISYGYDLYIPNVCRKYAQDVENLPINSNETEQRIQPLSSIFYEAAWELCRRGILRPGVRRHQEQVTEDGSGGNGYSLTTMGRTWLANADTTTFIPTEPSRVAELLGGYRDLFGEGFFQRAQEAIKCYSATAYLGSCVMSGAATESILLSLAIQKSGDEEGTLRTYFSAQGRKRVEDGLLANVPDPLARKFRNLTDLLKYWRDDASHGVSSEISEFEAHEAIIQLLRFSQFSSDHRTDLTTP